MTRCSRSVAVLAAALVAGTLAAAPAAASGADAAGTRVGQSENEAGTRARSPKRPLRRTLTTVTTRVAAPRTVTEAPAVAPAQALAAAPAPAPVTEVVQAVQAPALSSSLAAPAPVQALPTGAHAFLNVNNGAVTRWNPCQPVPWQFNPAGAPAGGLQVVQAAMATLAEKTGLPLQYEGTVGTTPTASYLTQSYGSFRPLLVGWSSAQESDLLTGGDASLVGMARILWTGSYDAAGRNHTQIASGVVALNRASQAGTSGPASWYTFVLHELGHAVGLGHVDDGEQVMRASIPSHLSTYGSGDLQGLRAVGSAGGCLPNIR